MEVSFGHSFVRLQKWQRKSKGRVSELEIMGRREFCSASFRHSASLDIPERVYQYRQKHGNNMYSHNDWALGKSLTVKEMDGWCLSLFPTCQGSQSSHSVWSQGSHILKYPDETTNVKTGSRKGCPRDGRGSHLYCHPSCSTMVWFSLG